MSYTENIEPFTKDYVDNVQKISAGLGFNNNLTVTPMTTVGTWYSIITNIPLVFKKQGNEFTNSTLNEVIYNGSTDIKRNITAIITAITTGNFRDYEISIFKNNTLIPNATSIKRLGTKFDDISLTIPNVEIVDNDYFEVKVRQIGGSQRNLIVEKMDLIIN